METNKDKLIEKIIEEDKTTYIFERRIRKLIEDESIKRAITDIVDRCEICELNVKFIKDGFKGFELKGYEEGLRDIEEEWFSRGYYIDWKSIHQNDVITFHLD